MSCPNVSHHSLCIYLWSNSQPRPLFPFLSLSPSFCPSVDKDCQFEVLKISWKLTGGRRTWTRIVAQKRVFACVSFVHVCFLAQIHMGVFTCVCVLETRRSTLSQGFRRDKEGGNYGKWNQVEHLKKKTKTKKTLLSAFYFCVCKSSKSQTCLRDPQGTKGSCETVKYDFHLFFILWYAQ